MHDSGNRKAFPGGGMRDTAEGKERFELIWTSAQPYQDQLLTRMALWMARGAEKYEDRNWEQFDGPEAEEHAKASLLRHVFKFLSGQTDEDHAAAVVFNVQAIELVRWKARQKLELDMMAESIAYVASQETAEVQYFRENSDSDWYYRWDGKAMTFLAGEDGERSESCYEDPGHGNFLDIVTEIPINEVPEWAR